MTERQIEQPGFPADLPTIQRWMQAVITHPRGVSEGIDSPAAKAWIDLTAHEVEAVVTPSRKRSSLERLNVYGNAYFSRLTQCLESIFPTFSQVVGHETFEQFALAYLQQYPSRSYTLNNLGQQFVPFLETTKPPAERQGWEDFLIELAQLEWAIDRVFDGPGYEGQACTDFRDLESLAPDIFWQCRVTLVPCLRLLAFAFPVNTFLTNIRRDASTPMPAVEPTWLALTRRDFIVRRVPLTQFQWQVLQGLGNAQTVGEAIEAALPYLGDNQSASATLAAAFQKFAAERLFLAINR